MTDESAIETARRRVQEAKEKFDRQQQRYAMQVVESGAASKSEKAQAAKALMAELEAQFEAAEEALRQLEEAKPAG
jgi:serine/threonine protein kinase HipA of HipAB toxin-antitoxin module